MCGTFGGWSRRKGGANPFTHDSVFLRRRAARLLYLVAARRLTEERTEGTVEELGCPESVLRAQRAVC
ncbi:hypothetical protein JOB18_030684 [Solea senegalensis]|uniref:Uncharacterized protein n=1 Tax=Solea senegalensis TaxID=28829 RepID=A0AAV6T087_SOLSE|nr:hypothetical protein JOB18_030684 [Solea senegalensis]